MSHAKVFATASRQIHEVHSLIEQRKYTKAYWELTRLVQELEELRMDLWKEIAGELKGDL